MHSFSVFVLQWNILGDQSELISYTAASINIIFGAYLYLHVIYSASNSHVFCAALYCLLYVCLFFFFFKWSQTSRFSGKISWRWNASYFPLQILCEIFSILRRIQPDIVNVYMSPSTEPSSDFKSTGIFSTDFRKPSNIKFRENPLLGVEWFYADRHTDRQTDEQTYMTMLIVDFRNFDTRLIYIMLFMRK